MANSDGQELADDNNTEPTTTLSPNYFHDSSPNQVLSSNSLSSSSWLSSSNTTPNTLATNTLSSSSPSSSSFSFSPSSSSSSCSLFEPSAVSYNHHFTTTTTTSHARWRLLSAAVKSKQFQQSNPLENGRNHHYHNHQNHFQNQNQNQNQNRNRNNNNKLENRNGDINKDVIFDDPPHHHHHHNYSNMIIEMISNEKQHISFAQENEYSKQNSNQSESLPPSDHQVQNRISKSSFSSNRNSKSSSSSSSSSSLPSICDLRKLIQTYGLMQYEYECQPSAATIVNNEDDEEDGDDHWIETRWSAQLFDPKINISQKNNENLITTKSETVIARISFAPNRLTVHDLAGFDNSGNVRLWPCEEVLAYLIAFNRAIQRQISGTSVCEIGAGMTALAGLVALAHRLVRYDRICLTDGNDRTVRNVRRIVAKNFPENQNLIHVRRLRWEVRNDRRPFFADRFHTIIGADCLFVRTHHLDLLDTIDDILVMSSRDDQQDDDYDRPRVIGTCFIVAPRRGETLNDFCRLVEADRRFRAQLYEHYDRRFDAIVAECAPLPAEQYPFLVVLRRSCEEPFQLF